MSDRNEILEEAVKAVIGAPVFGKKDDAIQDAKNIQTIDICVKAIRNLKTPLNPRPKMTVLGTWQEMENDG